MVQLYKNVVWKLWLESRSLFRDKKHTTEHKYSDSFFVSRNSNVSCCFL